nr:vegetative cell wall protein gp1-like [Aegilops tauschii subsp. strangulata]
MGCRHVAPRAHIATGPQEPVQGPPGPRLLRPAPRDRARAAPPDAHRLAAEVRRRPPPPSSRRAAATASSPASAARRLPATTPVGAASPSLLSGAPSSPRQRLLLPGSGVSQLFATSPAFVVRRHLDSTGARPPSPSSSAALVHHPRRPRAPPPPPVRRHVPPPPRRRLPTAPSRRRPASPWGGSGEIRPERPVPATSDLSSANSGDTPAILEVRANRDQIHHHAQPNMPRASLDPSVPHANVAR